MLKFIPILLTVLATAHAFVIPGPELHNAAAYGNNASIVDSLIKNGADCKSRDSIGRSLLLAAASSGNEAIFDIAIKSIPSVNDTDNYGSNAMSWAIYGGNLKIIKKIRSLGGIYKKNSIIWRDSIGGAYYGSPMNCVAGRNEVSINVMKYLVDSLKASINEREFTQNNEEIGWIPLHWAVESDNFDKVQYLLSGGAFLNDFSPYDCATPIGLVAFNSTIAGLLLEKGATLDSSDNYRCLPPVFSLGNRNTDSLIYLLMNNYKKIKKPEYIFSTLLKLCLTDSLTSDFEKVFDFVKQHSITVDTSEIFKHVIMRKNHTALDYLIKNEVITAVNYSIPVDLFQSKDDVYFDDAPISMNFSLSTDKLIERADSCFALLIKNNFDFADNSVRNDCFLEALQIGCTKSVQAMLKNGFSLECIPENDKLIVYSLISNDTVILDALVKAGHTIKNRHFLDRELTGCTSGTLQHAFQLAQSKPSENPEDTKDLITCVLLAASRNGCVDLVKSLHKSGARLDLYKSKNEQDDSDNSDDDYKNEEADTRTTDPAYQNAVAFNLLGTIDIELLNYFKSVNKNAFELYFKNAFENISNTFLIKCDSVEYDYLINNCNRSMKPAIIEKALNLLPNDSMPSLGIFVFKKYHTLFSDEQLVDMFSSKLADNDNVLFELFNNDMEFDKKHDRPSILAASHILNGDTIQAEKHILKSKAIKKYRLLYKCVSDGNYKGLKYLLNKNITISKKESNKLWPEFLVKLCTHDIPVEDSLQVLGLIDLILEKYYIPGGDNQDESNLTLLNRFIKEGNSKPNNINRAIAIKFIEHGVSFDITKNRGVSPLIIAIESEDSILVKYLLSKGMNPNETNKVKEEESDYSRTYDTTPPLLYAIRRGNSGICRELIKSGASIFVKDEDGKSIIECAITNNLDTLALEILTTVKPDKLGMFDFKNRPVITRAISDNCSIELIEKLIQSGADVNYSFDDYDSPILALIHESGNEKSDMVLDLLIKYGADLNFEDSYGSTLVHAAVQYDNLGFAEKFLSKGIDIDKPDNNGNTPLITALEKQNDSISLYLLKKGADVNVRNDEGMSPLHYAAKNCNQSIVQVLCANGADINMRNDDGMNPLEFLINSISDSVNASIDSTIKLLLTKGAKIDKGINDGSTILHAFAKVNGAENYIKVCTKAGIDINTQNNDGYTALMEAIRFKNEKFACELLKAGANIHLKSEDGNTLLHHIANSGIEFSCFSSVLSKIKNVDAVNDEGNTPLHIAATKSPGLFSTLLSSGASLVKKDSDGNTALLLSAKNNMPNNVYLAIKHNADINVKNNYNQTPLLYAIESNNYPSVVLLLNAHAKFTDGKSELKKAIEHADSTIITCLLKAGLKIDSIDSFATEVKDDYYYDSEEIDSAIALIKKPLQDLPQLPDIESNIKSGFWWHSETVPLSTFKKGTCTLTDKQVNSIDEADELLSLDRYQLELHSQDSYNIDKDIKMIGSTVVVNSTKWNMTQKNNFLYLTNEESNECKVYQYAGNEMPESWKRTINSSYYND